MNHLWYASVHLRGWKRCGEKTYPSVRELAAGERHISIRNLQLGSESNSWAGDARN